VKSHQFDAFAAGLILLTIVVANLCLWLAVVQR